MIKQLKIMYQRFPLVISIGVLLLPVMFIVNIFLAYKHLTLDLDSCKIKEIPPPLKERLVTNNNHKLAVLVPYRDRFEELLEFAPHINKFLNNQHVMHDIFVLNQVDHYRFNRASLINVGYLIVKNKYDYIAMHDVDLLPLNANLTYSYPEQPLHLAAPNLHPRYHYEKFIGGILLINRDHFQLVNGLSNRYWGWGLEDDEFYVRLKEAELQVHRPTNIATGINDTFKHIHGKHRKRDTTKCYNQREITRKRDRKTGLHDVKYEIQSFKKMTIDNAPLTVVNIQLFCDFNLTPWCDCTNIMNKHV